MKQRLYSGFTLVEMAVVLVIIGIISGLAIKGRSAYNSALVRKELAIVSRIRDANAAYFIKFNTRVPGNDITQLTVEGIIPDADLRSAKSGNQRFSLNSCAIDATKFHFITNANSNSTCLSMDTYNLEMACFTETITDDRNEFGGKARKWDNSTNVLTGNGFDNCRGRTGTIPYAFLLD